MLTAHFSLTESQFASAQVPLLVKEHLRPLFERKQTKGSFVMLIFFLLTNQDSPVALENKLPVRLSACLRFSSLVCVCSVLSQKGLETKAPRTQAVVSTETGNVFYRKVKGKSAAE